ncbi:MAG: SAM-dependent chlorinase/fluorinase [Chitinispirillaceae bacterium]|nr:SAM-dependent chlorinase/fluorinase [Chitinispirillaceae bacterium]
MSIISLITDYGKSDWFAGEMKGAIAGIAPHAMIIDITHDIEPGDIKNAAFSLLACYRTFPEGTIFCVVVDPGVGTSRAALAIKAGSRFFVGPDNGVLSWALLKEPSREIRRIESPELLPREISSTFHGRDIFAPVAAHLSLGIPFEKVGPLHTDMISLHWPAPQNNNGMIVATIIHIDRFGNAITAIDKESLCALPSSPKIQLMKYGTEVPFCTHFQQVPTGQGLAYIGSSGYLEIAINNANASVVFGLQVGDRVAVCCQ